MSIHIVIGIQILYLRYNISIPIVKDEYNAYKYRILVIT